MSLQKRKKKFFWLTYNKIKKENKIKKKEKETEERNPLKRVL